MKYIVVFIQGSVMAGSYDQPQPGTMIEVERFYTLEDANTYARQFIKRYGDQVSSLVILPYYEVEEN